MKIIVSKTAEELGLKAAEMCKELIEKSILEKGVCRMVFSTGASQFSTFDALLRTDIDWTKVCMFHLDEYVALPDTHIASFRKYLKERFINKVNLKQVCLVNGEADPAEDIARLTSEIRKAPVDIGLIGIGENAHIAFNDPPADFQTNEAYKVVNLSDTCKKQQVGEGWFETVNDVPEQAITMTVHEIMNIKNIISCVPYAVKAKAVKDTATAEISSQVPSTILRNHKNFTLLVDADSASLLTTNDLII